MCAFLLLEICLLTDDRRVASVKASTTVDLFSLSKEQFQVILEEYPEMKQTMGTVAVERLHKIGLSAPRKLSAHVSELLPQPAVSEGSVIPPGRCEGIAESSEPLRRRQASSATEDELVDVRRWSDCPQFDPPLHAELQTPPPKRRMSLLSTGGRRTSHKVHPTTTLLGQPGGNPERLPRAPITEAETSPKDTPTSSSTGCVAPSKASPSPSPIPTASAPVRRSTKVHPLPPVPEGTDLG